MNWYTSVSKSLTTSLTNYRSLSSPSHLIKLVGEFGIGSPPEPPYIQHVTSTNTTSHTPLQTYDQIYHSAQHRSKPINVNGRYTNPFSTWREPSWSMVRKWHKERKQYEQHKLHAPQCNNIIPNNTYTHDYTTFDDTLPIIQPNIHAMHNPPHDQIQYTWFGHASLLVQYQGINILIDPHFTQRAAPLSFMGPQRYRTLPCNISDLPPIDIICISHNHYDHLDYTTIKQLVQHSYKHNKHTKFYVPYGIDKWLRRWTSVQSHNVIGLDWWHSYNNDTRTTTDLDKQRDTTNTTPHTYRVTAVPAQHWSQRTFFDRNKTLWCGFMIELDTFKFYYSGDSGYNPSIAQIQHQFNSVDLAALPIGAFEPQWFMQPQHWSPEQAVQVHNELQCKQTIAIHFGTFDLADDSYNTAPNELYNALDQSNIQRDKFIVPVHGHTHVLNVE